jgi:predicted glycosyltransferase
MKIWLDLANSPQVLFFRPIICEFNQRGHHVQITTRDYAQTTQLADQYGLSHTIIGRHGGRGLYGLIRQNYLRVFSLVRWARSQRFDLAISHNSYSQVVAARLLHIPTVTLMDYEHQPLNHLCFRLANRVIVPESFPPELIKTFGAGRKTLFYPGIKEQVYLTDYFPQVNFRQKENLPINQTLIVIRPPAPWTAYHRFENDLFDELLAYLATKENVYLLFLPRIPSQVQSVCHIPNLHVTQKVYRGPDLLYCADVVISGGGTMNREAAVLGTPTYTIFRGKMGAVDRYLIQRKRMTWINSIGDFQKISLEKKKVNAENMWNRDLIGIVTEMILKPLKALDVDLRNTIYQKEG